MRPSDSLRTLLRADDLLILPGAYDGLSALLIERAGFPALFVTGFGVAASHLGVPDIGLLTGSQAIERASTIAAAVGIPVLADMDTGYGNALNVVHTVRACERAGIAGVILEDQESPKRCGHMEGKVVVPAERHIAHLKAAREASPDMVIVARTDARAPHGLDEAIRRGHLYAAAGIDALFVEALTSEDEIARVVAEFPGLPLVANMVEGGKTPELNRQALQDIGYAAALFPVSALLAAAGAIEQALTALHDTGSTAGVPMMSFASIQEVVGLPEWRGYDALYAENTPDI